MITDYCYYQLLQYESVSLAFFEFPVSLCWFQKRSLSKAMMSFTSLANKRIIVLLFPHTACQHFRSVVQTERTLPAKAECGCNAFFNTFSVILGNQFMQYCSQLYIKPLFSFSGVFPFQEERTNPIGSSKQTQIETAL